MADEPTRNQNGLPLHAQVSEVPVRTPIDVRFGLTLLPARYIFRAVSKTLTDSGTPDIVRRYTTIPVREHLFAQPLFTKVNNVLAKASLPEILSGSVPSDVDEIAKKLRETEAGATLKNELRTILAPYDAAGEVNNLLQHAIHQRDPKTNLIKLTDESKNRIRGHLAEPLFEFLYDNALGAGSLWMTYTIRQRVMNDMKSLYSEAVGYEQNKDPTQVTIDDIFASKNTIVQSTVKNFTHKQNQRLAISALPFLKNLPSIRATQFGDLAIGAWGMLWAFDVWGREPTMLELLADFVNDRLNLKFGFGDKIKPTDIINLYQQYALKTHPDWSFKTILSRDPGENRQWAENEGVFARIAELMNESYNYKHTTVLDPKTGSPMVTADFTLPKFIFLLGHDLINTREPEWTKTYIEIANTFGMDAVKETMKAQKSGKTLTDVLAKYPVNIHYDKLHNAAVLTTTLKPEAVITQAEPTVSTHISTDLPKPSDSLPHPEPVTNHDNPPTHQVSHPKLEQVGVHSTHQAKHATPQLAI